MAARLTPEMSIPAPLQVRATTRRDEHEVRETDAPRDLPRETLTERLWPLTTHQLAA